MAKVARRRAMPHHRVPEPKETSPIFERLRSELKWKVRHRVCEAVDAVCIAFEDELTQLMQPAVPRDYSYELFYDCCSRLTRFIESNMSTTPGFMVEMDRLIFACHSGASGTSVRKAMTKDLQIGRCQKSEAKVEGDSDQPARSRGNTAIAKKKAVATGGDEDGVSSDNPAPIGTTSRQWVTRKRLSTRSHSSGVKRLKKSAESGRDERELEKRREVVVKEDVGNEEVRKDDKEDACHEKKQQRCARVLSRKMRGAKLTLKRDKCIRRLKNDFGDAPGNEQDAAGGDDGETESSQGKHVGEAVRRGGARGAEPGRRKRWSLRRMSKLATESRAPKQKDKDGEVDSHISKETQAPAGKVVALNEKGAVTGSRTDIDMAKEGNLGTGAVPMESTRESFEPKQSDKANDIKPQTSSSPIDSDLTKAGRYLTEVDGDEEDTTSNGSENGLEHDVEVIPKKNDTSEDDRSGVVHDFEQAHPSEAVQATELESAGGVDIDMGNGSVVESTGQTKDESQAHDQEDNRITGIGTVSTKTHTEHDDLESLVATDGLDETANPEGQKVDHAGAMDSSNEPPVPGLCDAGMRPAHEASQFKDWLRKSIQFVDAVLCKPPPGKACFRDCKNIRERQCVEGVPCRDEFCHNWHNAEAHTERCTNPLCEFRNRILLREIMHQIANLDVDSQALQSQWENKTLELIVATTANSNQLNNDIKELERSIDDAKEEMESLKNKRRLLLANLSAIGVMPGDDEADRFPDFESHYI